MKNILFRLDGRFILELARAREGEKVAWVPVPKKTFWPPPGSTSSLSTYRQESSTSLSGKYWNQSNIYTRIQIYFFSI